MDASNEKYLAYITQLNSVSASDPRPMILVLNKQGIPKIIYNNKEFDYLVTWGITASRLESDREFQKNCLDLFDSFSNTKDNFHITVGSQNIQVDLYCRAIRSLEADKAGILATKSDLIMAQVDLQEYQEILRKYSNKVNTATYQSMVIDRQIDEQNAKLSELFDSMSSLNDIIATQGELLNILKNHWFLKLTRNVSLKSIDISIRVLLVILSTLNLLNPSISGMVKTILDQTIEIIKNDTTRPDKP